MRTALVALASAVAACSHAPPGAPACSADTRARETPRSWELWATLGLSDDRWDDRSHGTTNVGAEALWGFNGERYHRVGVGVAGEYGHFGDNSHGPVNIEPSVSYRGAFVQDPIVTFYVLAKTGLQMPEAALRPRVGLGVEALKAGFAEVSGDALVALDGHFQESRSQIVVPGVSVALGFEWGGVVAPVRTTVETDLTCLLYSKALHACQSVSSPTHAILCDKVSAALDTEKHPIREQEDSTTAFLRAVRDEVQGIPELENVAGDLLKVHAGLEGEWTLTHEAGRFAARNDRELTGRCVYAPYAVELRKALGCDTKPPSCPALSMCPVTLGH